MKKAADFRPAADNRQWALDNIYTIAIREERYGGERAKAWAHVRRLCERFGCAVRAVRLAQAPGTVSNEVSAVDPIAAERPQEVLRAPDSFPTGHPREDGQ